MTVLIYNEDLITKHNIKELIIQMEKICKENQWDQRKDYHTYENNLDYLLATYYFGDDNSIMLLHKRIDRSSTTNEMLKQTVDTISKYKDRIDVLYIHLTCAEIRPPRFRDYIHVRVVDELVDQGLLKSDQVFFYTSFDGFDGFKEDTGYEIRCLPDAEKLLERVLKDEFKTG